MPYHVVYCWELGAGLGHVYRARNMLTALDGHLTKATLLLKSPEKFDFDLNVSTSVAPCLRLPKKMPGASPNYAHVVYRSGWYDDEVLQRLISWWIAQFEALSPDFVLLDHAPTAMIAADMCQIPYILVGNGFEVPPDMSPFPALQHWRNESPDTLTKWTKTIDSRLKRVCAKISPAYNARRLSDYFSPDNAIIDAHPELDHYANIRQKNCQRRYFLHTNMLPIKAPAAYQVGARPAIFVYLNMQHTKLVNTLKFVSRHYDVFGYFKNLHPSDKLALTQIGIDVAEKPLDIKAALARCSAGVCHAGIGTVTQAWQAHKPVLVIPEHVEQQMTAYNITRLGIGAVLPMQTSEQIIAAFMLKAIPKLASGLPHYTIPKNNQVWPHSLFDFIAPQLAHATAKQS